MLRTGKQKFVCRRIVTYSNTHQTRVKVTWIKDVLRNFYLQKRIHANFIVCIATNDQEVPEIANIMQSDFTGVMLIYLITLTASVIIY